MSLINKIKPNSKVFFSAVPWRNLLLFSVFLFLAFVFWLMLFFRRENIEVQHMVPIQFVNMPSNEVFNTPPPEFIEVIFRDNGMNIFRQSFSRRDTIFIDMESFREREFTSVQGSEMQHLIRTVFPTGQFFTSSPISISLETSQLETRELTVVFDGEVFTNRASLVADSVFFSPETIQAYGLRQALDGLEVATTEFMIFRNLRATSQFSIRIKPVDGIRFVPDIVDIHIPVVEYTERSIEIPITAINVPANLNVIFFPSQVTVSFSVALTHYRAISPADFKVELDYHDFYANENGRVSLQVTQQATVVSNVRVSPSTVEFLFEYLPQTP